MEPETSVARRVKSLLDFKPGDRLSDDVSYFIYTGEQGSTGRALSQVEALAMSECKRSIFLPAIRIWWIWVTTWLSYSASWERNRSQVKFFRGCFTLVQTTRRLNSSSPGFDREISGASRFTPARGRMLLRMETTFSSYCPSTAQGMRIKRDRRNLHVELCSKGTSELPSSIVGLEH